MPAHFGDRGARRFVRWFMLGLDETAAFYGGSMRACRRVWLKTAGAVATNGGHAVDDDLRLLEARGDRLSGSVMDRAA